MHRWHLRGRRTAAVLMASAVLVAAGWMTAPSGALEPDDWTVVELQRVLPYPAMVDATRATHVNDVNEAGYSAGSSWRFPVLWDPDGTPIALPIPAGFTHASVTALNDKGGAVGVAASGSGSGASVTGVAWLGAAPIVLIHP